MPKICTFRKKIDQNINSIDQFLLQKIEINAIELVYQYEANRIRGSGDFTFPVFC